MNKHCAALLVAGVLAASSAWAQKVSDDVVRIGVLTDLSGPNQDVTGAGSVWAAEMAVKDFGGTVLGKPIEIISADHQNKPDLAAAKAREWYDTARVDMITDAVVHGIPIMQVAKEKNRIALITSTGNTRITGDLCNPMTVQWVFDTDVLSTIVAREIVKRGGDTWFFLTADYVFGASLEKSATAVVNEGGAKVVGSVKHPFLANDLSSFLLRAQQSGAKVIGLANASGDTRNSIKQAEEFGMLNKQTLAGLLLFIQDIHSLGLQTTQGMLVADGFYWDLNDDTRAFGRRYFDKVKRMPNMLQAGVYSAVTHYLKAIKAAGTDDAEAVMAKIREMPVNDLFAKNGRVREDGRMVHDMFLMQVKKPSESKSPWDYYHVRRVVPAAEAFPPLTRSVCPLVKK